MREVLVTHVDAIRVALPVAQVSELQRAVAERPLPGAPEVIAGVVNLRGRAVAVADLRARLGRPSRSPVSSDLLCFLEVDSRAIAVRVDGAECITSVPVQAIEPVVWVASGVHGRHATRGVAAVREGILIVEDVGALLSDEELSGLDAALTALVGDAEPAL